MKKKPLEQQIKEIVVLTLFHTRPHSITFPEFTTIVCQCADAHDMVIKEIDSVNGCIKLLCSNQYYAEKMELAFRRCFDKKYSGTVYEYEEKP
ncbi:MAG: hypothetical protein GY853_14545 [PVC group bacterium]|nr:hypothetical protein [PVC group bacterium]